jgi:death-on-curing family protein
LFQALLKRFNGVNKKMNKNKKLAIYQAKDGAINLEIDNKEETIWASQSQIASLFEVTSQNITIHLKNIFKTKELDESATCKEILQVQKEGDRSVKRKIKFYNLDLIISVGYRINSKKATQFRQWATKTLKQHITKGFTINESILKKKENLYLQALEDLRLLSGNNKNIKTEDILELIKYFSYTWFSLESYDKDKFPKKGTKKSVKITADDLKNDLQKLKQELVERKEATEIFGQERQQGSLGGIVGNVFQTVFGRDAYQTLEEKSAHLLYFIVKNHPFVDGNKRSGAFAFVWFLQKAGLDFKSKITPETLATLTILVAESDPKEKDKIVGIILLLLNFNKK